VAIGLAGVPATIKERGNLDAYGRKLMVTEPAFSDELAAASGLVVSKSAKTPVVIIRGLKWTEEESCVSDLLRKKKEDMFL
jgi:coenzyme F420-0:L-glutamate ligase/coenzyme F420-1:gamma-L-glutamate ligase